MANGLYMFSSGTGRFTLTAEKNKYEPYTCEIVIERTETLTREIRMISDSDCTVRFIGNKGNVTSTLVVKRGETVPQPDTPDANSEYPFPGWYISGTDTEWDFSRPVNSDLTLYAQWDRQIMLEYTASTRYGDRFNEHLKGYT